MGLLSSAHVDDEVNIRSHLLTSKLSFHSQTWNDLFSLSVLMQSSFGDLPPVDHTLSTQCYSLRSTALLCEMCVEDVRRRSHSSSWYLGVLWTSVLPDPSWYKTLYWAQSYCQTALARCDKLRVPGINGEIYQLNKVITNRSLCHQSAKGLKVPDAHSYKVLHTNIFIIKNRPFQSHYLITINSFYWKLLVNLFMYCLGHK